MDRIFVDGKVVVGLKFVGEGSAKGKVSDFHSTIHQARRCQIEKVMPSGRNKVGRRKNNWNTVFVNIA